MSHGGCLQTGRSRQSALQHGPLALQEVDLCQHVCQRRLIWHARLAVQHRCIGASELRRASTQSSRQPSSTATIPCKLSGSCSACGRVMPRDRPHVGMHRWSPRRRAAPEGWQEAIDHRPMQPCSCPAASSLQRLLSTFSWPLLLLTGKYAGHRRARSRQQSRAHTCAGLQLPGSVAQQLPEPLLMLGAAAAGLRELRVQQPDQAPLLRHLALRQRLAVRLDALQLLLQVLPDLRHRQHLLQGRGESLRATQNPQCCAVDCLSSHASACQGTCCRATEDPSVLSDSMLGIAMHSHNSRPYAACCADLYISAFRHGLAQHRQPAQVRQARLCTQYDESQPDLVKLQGGSVAAAASVGQADQWQALRP